MAGAKSNSNFLVKSTISLLSVQPARYSDTLFNKYSFASRFTLRFFVVAVVRVSPTRFHARARM